MTSLSVSRRCRRVSRGALLIVTVLMLTGLTGRAQTEAVRCCSRPRVYDGTAMHEGWAVLVRGRMIAAAGPAREPRPCRRAPSAWRCPGSRCCRA